MGRFVLFHRGEASAPEDLERIRSLASVQVLEEALPKLLLVEGEEEELRSVIEELPDWFMTPESEYRLGE